LVRTRSRVQIPLSAPRKRYYPNLWVISFLIKDEIVKRDLKARKENSPLDCFYGVELMKI
jgi:hypothetical protein